MEQTTFSQKLQRLEDIVRQLESSDIELEQGLKLLEEGVNLHKQCQSILTESQVKITTLLKTDQPVRTDPSSHPLDQDTSDQSQTSVAVNPNQDELPF